MKLKYIICYCLILIPVENLYAQEVMTLERCRELALEGNKSMAIADRNREKAEFTQKVYRSNYFPKISATGNYIYTNTEMNKTIPGSYLPTFITDPSTGELIPDIVATGIDGNPVFRQYAYFPDMDLSLKLNGTWTAGLRAEQPIYSGGKITSGYNMAKIGNEIAALNRDLTRAEVVVKSDEAYWTYVQAQELLKLALSYHKVVTELLHNVQNAQEVGLKHVNDVLKVQVKVNEAELQILQAKNGVNLSRKNLCHIIGLPLDTAITLPDSFEDMQPVHPAQDTDYSRRPEFAILEQQTRLKEEEIKVTRSDFLPQIGVMANYGYLNGVKLNGNRLFDTTSFSVVASVSIPLFQWGEGRNKIRAAKAERDIMELQRDDMNELMELELAKAFDTCEESALEVRMTTKSLQQAEENMRVSADRHQEGMETLADYLEAQTVWQSAFMEYIKAKTQQRLNQTYYMKAIGGL